MSLSLRLALCSLILFSGLSASKEVKEWSILMYCNANGLGTQVLNNIVSASTRVRPETTNVMVQYQYDNGHAWRLELGEKTIAVKEFIRWVDTFNGDNALVDAFTHLVTNNPAKRYAVFFIGFGSGILDLVWDWNTNAWYWPSEFLARGILYDAENNFRLSSNQLVTACQRINDVLVNNGHPDRLDLLVTDADMMNSLELLTKLPVSVFCGTQDRQAVQGIPYDKVFNILNMHDVDAIQLAKEIVQAFDGYYRLYGTPTPISYTAMDVSMAGSYAAILDELLAHLATISENESLAHKLYALRNTVRECAAFSDYVDLYDWVLAVSTFINDPASNIEYFLRNRINGVIDRLKDYFGKKRTQDAPGVVIAHAQQQQTHPGYGVNVYYPQTWLQPEYTGMSPAWLSFVTNSAAHFRAQQAH